MKIKMKHVPAAGDVIEKEIEAPATGMSVAEVLKQAGIKPNKKLRYTVDGKNAQLDTHVGKGAKFEVKEVTVTERPSGS